MKDPVRGGDLVALVADKNMEAALCKLLARPQSLQIRRMQYKVYVHPDRDPGCLLRGHEFVRAFVNQFDHCLVVLDHKGCGHEEDSGVMLEDGLKGRLAQAGWEDRAAAIVIEPELEAWVWSDSPHVAEALGWRCTPCSLRTFLVDEGLWEPNEAKPKDPKRAMEYVLRKTKLPRSSAIYAQIARNVGVSRCHDVAFRKLRDILKKWFLAVDKGASIGGKS